MKKLIALLIVSLSLVACGPSKEEIEAQERQELIKKNGGREVKDGKVIKIIDGCEYIEFSADDHEHKGNCSNPIHTCHCR